MLGGLPVAAWSSAILFALGPGGLSIARTTSETLTQPCSQAQMCLKSVHTELHVQGKVYTDFYAL